jgi:membrane protein implicated in regulation of membrane protease activity
MYALYLASFLLGLLFGVRAMLVGVERDTSGAPYPAAPTRELRASLSLPLLAGFATVFGISGYLLARYSQLGVGAQVGVAAVLGALFAVAMATMVLKWAIPSARDEVVDERYLLQGSPARVVRAIGADAAGTVEYDAGGTQVVSEARSFDNSPIEPGTEVVIERVEGGVAYVERWALVEQRL